MQKVSGFSSNEYQLIGKLVVEREPAFAANIVNSFRVSPAKERDLSKIPQFFTSYCQMRGVEQEALLVTSGDRTNKQLIRVFVSAIMRLYCPELSLLVKFQMKVRSGLVQGIQRTINRTLSNTTVMIRQNLILETVYDDFREDVDAAVNHLLALNPEV
ncbi:hypothetical protein [Flavihumibacter petaseus]|uniref:Uncharacterized protein n=1 Tax=Flavihumibacter petaseus NBRC 106054 TaxID=1220578 RepID=A0A0E9N1Q0_9BACT|nr:hypothetical protein [Flavihumibacter petaseus]GAO43779.1 hypothetical protein FPE01S_02_08850 [Flavihumibacter petaseus NBRC 106054]